MKTLHMSDKHTVGTVIMQRLPIDYSTIDYSKKLLHFIWHLRLYLTKRLL